MVKPPRDNLGLRQHKLNIRINDAFENNLTVDDVKDEPEVDEVAKFFKIDLAAKCRNVEYIIEVLKSGETLYAHRALKKCPWLYTDDYTHIINPEYLHDSIFPVTSMRVKRLILKNVVLNVRKPERAEAFYNYCMKIKMPDIALKCIFFTSEEFKLQLLQQSNSNILQQKFSNIKFIVGKSFLLLEAYMKMFTQHQDKQILRFRYFYPVNNVKYLELLETYFKVDDYYNSSSYTTKFDKKLCDDIMKKFKDRVLAKPLFYLNSIRTDILVRNITVDDAKVLMPAILPSSADGFWSSWFCHGDGKPFIDLLPRSEVLEFLKKIYKDKYPNEEFETQKCFYKQRYYEFMTVEQREKWALDQINSDRQVLGVGKDYLWYEFVNFKNAFEEIKKFVIVTKEPETRVEMLVTLVKAMRNNRDLEILFKYYYKRHANEPIMSKIDFMNQVITNQNVFEFDDACWESFYTLLIGVELYTYSDSDPRIEFPLENYKTVTLFYHILYEKKMPEELQAFLLDKFFPHNEDVYGDGTIVFHFGKLNDDRRQFLYNYLYNFFTDKINEYKNKPYVHANRYKTKRYYDVIVKLIRVFHVNPEIYKRKPKPQNKRQRTVNKNISDRQLLRDLKSDKDLVVKKLSIVKKRLIKNEPLKMNNFLKKIKIYFKNDITETCLEMFGEIMSEELGTESVNACVGAIFELGNENIKLKWMKECAPESDKIDFHNLDSQKLNIQRAICRYASNSLPPVPLDIMLGYMKGDYLRYCLHIFSVYIAALPLTASIKLVESVLNAPVSIQKHALRLAFQCLNVDSLKNISMDIWKKTKNVSLRSVIYQALYKRIVDHNESELYEILISFTLNLHDDDEKNVFKLVESNTLPHDILGDYRKATWEAVGEFKDKEPNITRKINVLDGIRSNLHLMDEEYIEQIIDEHLKVMFNYDKLEVTYSKEDIAALYKEKWNLAADYIVNSCFDENTVRYVELAKWVIKNCLKMWNEERSGKLVFQRCCWEFVQNLNIISLEYYTHSEWLIPIYEGILEVLNEAVPLHEIYMRKWEMQLVLCNRRAIKKNREKFENLDRSEVANETMKDFGQEVAKLVSEYVENKMYFTSVVENIKALIIIRVVEVLEIILYTSGGNSNEYLPAAKLALADGLVEFELMEAYLLALDLLPQKVSDCDEALQNKYQLVIDKALQFNHTEVQYAAQQKLLKSYE